MPPHEGKNAMYSLSIKVEYATVITLGRIVRLKSYRVTAKKMQKFMVFIHSILTRFCGSVFLKRFADSCFHVSLY
jgi:hypothetical protein